MRVNDIYNFILKKRLLTFDFTNKYIRSNIYDYYFDNYNHLPYHIYV